MIQPQAESHVAVRNVLLVSGDRAISAELATCLEGEFGCRVDFQPTLCEFGTPCFSAATDSIFLDLRSESIATDLHSLLGFGYHPPVYAFGDNAYGVTWSILADQVIAGRLRVPFDRNELIDALRRRSPGSQRRPWIAPKVVRGTTVNFMTHMPEMFGMLDRIESLAAHDVTLLLVGETGSGKTTLARLVHELSPRRDRKFVTVACGALPPDLIESELFGHVRGAFTGADQNKIGRFETCEGGTFLLDEIDLLGPKEQSKLLRVIETGEYEQVGSSETRRTDVRLIVCANVDLNQLMARQKFRADLYYRLNVLEFVVPPLRRRPADIVPLAIEFIDEFCRSHQISIDRIHVDFLDALQRYDWPGNIRELKNHMRRAVLFASSSQLTPHDLSPVILHGSPMSAASHGEHRVGNLANQVARTERELLAEALSAHGFKRSATARSLGISRVGLYKKLKKYGMLTLKAEGSSRQPVERLVDQ